MMRVEPTTDPSSTSTASASVTELRVSGMTCNNCARHVTEAIQSVAGVRTASVLLETGRASVSWAVGSEENIPALLQAVKQAGYEAKPLDQAAGLAPGANREQGWQSNLWIGALGTAPLMIGEWLFGLGSEPWFQRASFGLASVVQIFAGAQFYRGAWRQFKIGSSNMDTLVALGSTTAFGYSAWALFSGQRGHLYFMEAAAIITIISTGHWLEARVAARASGALKSLLKLAPQTARRLDPPRSSRREESQASFSKADESPLALVASVETEVSVSELKVGNLVALKPGDRVPTDGIVVDGASAVDESMLTGESLPTDKTAGTELYTGTVNLNGRLVMRVMATGEATALAHVVAAVQRAQSSRANIQRLGDRVSSIFVPAVVVIAFAAAIGWGLAFGSATELHNSLARFLWHSHQPAGPLAAAFMTAAAILIVACPCAMGLATPVAIMAGANAAARRGILIRDGVALEKAGKVTAVVFDKTGTLTLGKPTVAGVWKADRERHDVEGLAYAIARHSTHPLSKAVAAFIESGARDDRILTNTARCEAWREVRGAGLEARIAPDPASGIHRQLLVARLGSLRWLRQCGVDLAAGENFTSEWTGQGATLVGLTREANLLALFAIRDALKPGAPAVVEQVRRQGLRIYVISGDQARTAANIAQQAGVPAANVFAEVRPEEKAEIVKSLQQQGARVAFVGDGINDAPALEQADLGIAVSRASDIAREAADIILLKSEIEAVPESLGLARATLRTIKQNLFWAFFYNALGVPLAALGFMSPVLCAMAMGLSDVIVIGNALRLLRWRN